MQSPLCPLLQPNSPRASSGTEHVGSPPSSRRTGHVRRADRHIHRGRTRRSTGYPNDPTPCSQQGAIDTPATNATRVNAALVSVLHECGAEQVCVSIYGATATTYERMTGIPGSYTAFLHGLTLLAGADLPVVVRMPVTSLNDHEVEACRRLVEQYGRKFQYSLDLTPSVTGDVGPLEYRLPPNRKMAIDQQMLAGWGSAPMEERTCSIFPIHRMRLRPDPICDHSLWRDEPLHRLPHPPL